MACSLSTWSAALCLPGYCFRSHRQCLAFFLNRLGFQLCTPPSPSPSLKLDRRKGISWLGVEGRWVLLRAPLAVRRLSGTEGTASTPLLPHPIWNSACPSVRLSVCPSLPPSVCLMVCLGGHLLSLQILALMPVVAHLNCVPRDQQKGG